MYKPQLGIRKYETLEGRSFHNNITEMAVIILHKLNKEKDIKIFGGSTGIDFARQVCRHLSIEPGNADVLTFSEGNTFVRIGESVRGKDVYLVQPIGLKPNDEFVEILFWMDAFKRASANSATAVIPYFSYGKGDKKDEPRVSIRARVCAECIELAGADRIVTMDLHSPQIQGFFKKPVDHLKALPLLCKHIHSLNLKDYVIVSPDAGFAKQAREFSRYLGKPTVIGDKTRYAHDEKASILELIGDVKGKAAVIVDDFTISCGTLSEAARALEQNGATRVFACVTHMLLNEKGLRVLENSNIEKLICTDTVPNEISRKSDRIMTISAAHIFAEVLSRIHSKESISPLFDR